MKRVLFIVFILFLTIVLTSNISANFVCGHLNDSSELSGSWINVLVYYDEKTSDITSCKTSPENKFCCDLQDIENVNWQVNKIVHGEVYLPDLGYIAGPVSLSTTENGYDLFPEMQLKKVFNFNQEFKKILVNESSVLFNLNIHENYNNLKYIVNENPLSEVVVCESCSNAIFEVILEKGKNKITLTAYNLDNGREISEDFYIYSLDYLELIDDFQCKKCKNLNNNIYVPSHEKVNLSFKVNSSHPISGKIKIYHPIDWSISEEFLSKDYSLTHNLIEWEMKNDSNLHEKIYPFVSSGTWFKRRDNFKYEIQESEISKIRKVLVHTLTRFFPIRVEKRFSDDIYFEDSLNEIVSNLEPLILELDQELFEVIAIYPNTELYDAHAHIIYKERRFFNRRYITFNLLSTIPNYQIKNILIRFKVPKEDSFRFYYNKGDNSYSLYKEDLKYNYYQGEFSKKGSFNLKIIDR